MQHEKIEIHTEFIKLDQFLKFSGAVITGGNGKEMVEQKNVFVNGERCTQRGRKLRCGDIVEIEGRCFEVCTRED